MRDASVLARLLTELNEAVGASGVPPGAGSAPDNVIVSEEEMGERLLAVTAFETVLLAEREGNALGFVSIRILPYLDQGVPFAEVTDMYVVPGDRRIGVATALMSKAEEFALRQGCTSVHLITANENAGAQSFYLASGYEPLYVGFERFLDAEATQAEKGQSVGA